MAVTDPLGRTTRSEYDGLNRVKKIIDPISGQTQFAYDPNGNLLSVTDARNNATTYVYNPMDRLQTRTDPLLRVESYVYDNNGNLSQVTDRKSQVTTFTYDGLNRRTVTQFHDAKTITATYDAGNRVTQLVDTATGAGAITQGYDGLDRLASQTTPKGTTSYTNDAASRRATMTVTGQSAVTYTFDSADRLTQLTRGTSTVGLAYWDDNRRRQLTLPNGVTVDYTYDTGSKLTGVTYKLGAATLGTLNYAYDLAGNRQQVGGTWARTNLPAAVATTSYNAANRLTQWGASTLTYDFNGNLTNDGTKTYTWNVRDQLLSMTGASFQYDATGRRHRRVVSGTTRDFVYDGLNLVQEKQNATVKANVVTGLALDEVFTRIEGSTTRHLLVDALGSTLALTDPAGAVQTSYTYAPFGTTTSTGQSNANPFKFTGREDDGTGLYYYRARYYHPTLGRFISEDPLEFGGGDANLYAYVGNSPLNGTDPLGLMNLPPDPSGLGPEWKHDPSHRYPHGERYRDPSGRHLDFHRPRPGGRPGTHGGTPHWHDPNNFGKRALPPGFQVPDPAPLPPVRPPAPPRPPRVPRIPWWPWPGHIPVIPVNPCELFPELCGGAPAEAGTPNKSQQ